MGIQSGTGGGGPLPLCIGVTGHRDLLAGDEARLRLVFTRQLEDWLARAPNTPLHVLSAMAEGADLLAAECALALAERGRPVTLRIVLPMPWEDEYEHDFEPGVRARVKAVLDRVPAAHRNEPDAAWLAARFEPEARTGRGPRINGDRRVECYEAVGRSIARHCHLLVAFWDGRENGKPAGTARIVAERRAGIPLDDRSVSSVFRDQDRGPVLVLPTGRRQHGEVFVPGEPYFLGERQPDGAGARAARRGADASPPESAFGERLAAIEAFNRAAATLDTASVQASRQFLLPNARRPGGDDADPAWSSLEPAYAAADVLATRHQRSNHRARMGILAFALLIPTLAVFGGRLPDWMALGYPVLFVGMLAVAALNRRRQHHDRALHYRALAEALRVQLAWRLAGSSERVSRHYLRRHQAALGWMGGTLRCLCLQPPPRARPDAASLEALGTAWIVDQRDYHRRSAERRGRRAAELDRLAVALVALALAISLLLGVFPGTALGLLGGEGRGMLAGLAGSLPALAGCVLAYNAAMAHREVSRESERMAQLHARAAEALDDAIAGASGSPAVVDLLHEVGVECLRENAEWVFLHLDRPPEAKLD